MKKYNLKPFIILGSILILGLFNLLVYGFYLMDKEDQYGNLIYLKDELKDGDILLYSTNQSNEKYIDYGIVNQSIFGLSVSNRKNTVNKNLYKWVDYYSIRKIKAFRPLQFIDKPIFINNIQDSTKFKFIGETDN